MSPPEESPADLIAAEARRLVETLYVSTSDLSAASCEIAINVMADMVAAFGHRMKSAGRAEASAWRPGDEEARRGDLIQAAFAYHHSVTNYHYYEYAVVRWHDEGGYWCDAEGDIYTGPSDELPTWYRPFAPLPPPPEGGER